MSERDTNILTDIGPEKSHAGQKHGLFDRLRALFGLGATSIRDDIQDVLADISSVSNFTAQERSMLKNVLTMHELRVEDVMVPRADIIAVSADMQLKDVLDIFRADGHSRLPVHGDTLDDPRGMVHIRDFVDFLVGDAHPAHAQSALCNLSAQPGAKQNDLTNVPVNLSVSLTEANILRPVLFIPPSMPVLDLLVKMQTTRTHMALVIDEYGGTDGLVSIEDIVEVIVGDIEDEHDLDTSPKIEMMADLSYVIDARADLEEVSAVIDTDLTALSDADDVDTLGGLVTTLAGHVPVRGEIIVAGSLCFEILDADPRRVKRIKLQFQEKQNDKNKKNELNGDLHRQ